MVVKRSRFSHIFVRVVLPSMWLFAMSAQADDSKTLQLQPREEFSFDLPKISECIDQDTKEFNGVRITLPGSENQIFIGTGDDMEIKNSSSGREKTLFREIPEKTGFISKFEAKSIIKVNKYFISSLEIFDKLLQKNNWGRCLYFDSFFPHFLNGYYHLICAARNSECGLPLGARIPEKEYDVSLNSPKTDARINRWRSSPDTTIHVRIVSKELLLQLTLWQKVLDKADGREDVGVPKEFEDAMAVFVRIYFGLKAPAPVALKRSVR